MKPTPPLRSELSVLAATPGRGLSLLVRSMFPRAAIVVLVVMLVTIATIAVIASVRIKRAEDVAKCERVASDSLFFRTQLEEYRTMNGSFPTTEKGLRALVDKRVPDRWNTLTFTVVPE